jgi:hypothetical protein
LLAYIRNGLAGYQMTKTRKCANIVVSDRMVGRGPLNFSLVYRPPSSAPGTMDVLAVFVRQPDKTALKLVISTCRE